MRTYHEPDNRVVDHASGMEIAYSELEKRLDDLIVARMRAGAKDKQSGRT